MYSVLGQVKNVKEGQNFKYKDFETKDMLLM